MDQKTKKSIAAALRTAATALEGRQAGSQTQQLKAVQDIVLRQFYKTGNRELGRAAELLTTLIQRG